MSDTEIANSSSNGTAILLAKAAQVEEAKQLKIQELLQEYVDLEQDTASRLLNIKGELKALGYKTPRVRKPKNSLDKVQGTN